MRPVRGDGEGQPLSAPGAGPAGFSTGDLDVPVPPRPTRAALAFGALWVGWICGSLVTWGVELMVSGPTRWGDILLFDAIIGGFAAGAWAVSVLPLALFGTQRGWFFHVVPAPLIGAVCGVALLVLEYWIFFDVSPGDLVEGGTTFQDG